MDRNTPRDASSTIHGRDQIGEYEVAVKKDGRLLGIKSRTVADLGSYLQLLTPAIPTLTGLMAAGCLQVRRCLDGGNGCLYKQNGH